MTDTVIRYTTAEPDYDYSYTAHMGIVGFDKKGHAVRKVHIEKGRENHQCGRYASGVRMAIDHIEYAKQVEYGFIIPATTVTLDAAALLALHAEIEKARAGIAESRQLIRDEEPTDEVFKTGWLNGRDVTLQAAAQTLDAIANLLAAAEGAKR